MVGTGFFLKVIKAGALETDILNTDNYHVLHKQAGFTLIELMVVVVIMSVVVSVGVLSLGRLNQDLAQDQQAKIESFFTQVADQAAFNQKMYLVAPDNTGLKVFSYQTYQWQPEIEFETFAWHSGFKASWDVDKTFAEQQQLTSPGWVFWPSGDVLPGKILLEAVTQDASISSTDGLSQNLVTVSWNDALEFNLR